jgi:hypothetical protein
LHINPGFKMCLSNSTCATTSRSGEGLRLKLGTPLQVGTLLFNAAEEILSGERAAAGGEVAAASGVKGAMDSYRAAMARG